MVKHLTMRQKKFFEEYHQNGGNAYQAALFAGYTKRSAEVASDRILHNPNLQELWRKEFEKKSDFFRVTPGIREKITIDFILDKMLELYQTAKKESTKANVLDMLGKYRAMFTDKQEIVSKIAQITAQITSDFQEKPAELPPGTAKTLEEVMPKTENEEREAVPIKESA